MQRVYATRLIRCPFDCGFQGCVFQVDEHQAYLCPLRTIRCPHEGCNVQDRADTLERDHYPTCPQRREHCEHCQLPVLVAERDEHNCLYSCKEALLSRS